MTSGQGGFERAVTATWDFPRHVAGTTLLVQAGRAAGVTDEVLLRGTGLTPRDLSDHQRQVTAGQELRVVRNLLVAAPQVTGVAVGARYHASTFGPLGFALMSSATLGHAANLALRYMDLSFTFTIPGAEVLRGEVVVTVDDRNVPSDVRRFMVERDLAAIWTVLREISGGAPRLSAVALPFSRAAAADHELAFGVRPTWRPDAAMATLRLDATWLDHPLPQANEHALAMAESLCEDLVSPRRQTDQVTGEVRILVAQHLEAGAPMADVAGALGLSERSLRRRLTDAGTSYRAVLDEVRHDAADRLLADRSLDVEEIAARLGYAEATSFGAAYRRWTGHTPRGR